MWLLRSVVFVGLFVPLEGLAVEPLVARWDSPRTVKIDLFYFEPGVSPLGSDFAAPLMEQWTAILACTPAGPRIESCSFVDGVWYGFVKAGTNDVQSRNLPAPGTLEFTWTERGRLSAWDVKGDRQAFWDVVGNAVLEAGYRKPDVPIPPNRRREIGSGAEGFVARALAGALEWELPKRGDETTWKLAMSPNFTLRYLQTTSNSALVTTATRTAGAVKLDVAGSVSEGGDQTKVQGSAVFDPAAGRIVSGRYETRTTSSSPPRGPTRSIALVAPWSDGESREPATMPDPAIVN